MNVNMIDIVIDILIYARDIQASEERYCLSKWSPLTKMLNQAAETVIAKYKIPNALRSQPCLIRTDPKLKRTFLIELEKAI